MMVYLDNSATTRPCSGAVKAVTHCMEEAWFNPSAIYKPSLNVQKTVSDVRNQLLSIAGATGQQLYFTSGGTQADNLALLGTSRLHRNHGKVLLFSLDHPAVLACREELTRQGHTVEEIKVDNCGIIDLESFEKQLDPSVFLISVMHVNNEVGSVQPLHQIIEIKNRICREAFVHVDGVQAFLREPLYFNKLGLDSYSFSGHKIHALKGIGGLILRKDRKITPILWGGGQEQGVRSGTENTPGILSLGSVSSLFDPEQLKRMRKMKLLLLSEIQARIPKIHVNGPDPYSEMSAPHIINISFPPVRSQTLLFALEGDGIYVSAGSACASRKQKISGVLKAMNVPTQIADCSLRFSISPENKEEEMIYTAERLSVHYAMLKKYTRR